ncbi:hypothetical protein [Nonomuraea sp. NPDC049141]|uniref:hypothetical protein n=1 Tax=Nonomuraea sp. NPDC049141 TaxID=3155500 RepID=UPI0034094489
MATENSGAPHLPPSWPEAPQPEVPTSWPEAPRQDSSWPDSSRSGAGQSPWPDPAQSQPSWPDPAQSAPSWPDPAQSAPNWPDPSQSAPSWPDPSQSAPNWPDPSQSGSSWPDPSRHGAPPPQGAQQSRPDAAWSEAPPASNAWSNLGHPDSRPQPRPGDPLGHPASPDNQPTAYHQFPNPLGERAYPPQDDRGAPRGDFDQRGGPRPGFDDPGAPRSDFDHRGGPQPGFDQRGGPQPGFDDRGAPRSGSPLDGPRGNVTPLDGPRGNVTPLDSRRGGTPLDERAVPRSAPSPDDRLVAYGQAPGQAPPQAPGAEHHQGEHHQAEHGRPGGNLSRDPSDPENRFVTAGQISGSRTPPPERQQELWDNVFGDDYQAMGEPDSLDNPGKPIWIYALAGSVALALVGAVLWAFLAGPLAADKPTASSSAAANAKSSASPSSTPAKTTNSIPRLPRWSGKAAPVLGTVANPTAGITIPRLGGTWQQDQRTTVKTTYGFDTRQYVVTGNNTSAQILTGPLPAKLASSFTSEDDLEPVIKQVVLNARKRFFPTGNTVRKIAQQPIKVGQSSGRVIAYALTSGTEKATIVTAAINTGKDVPAIVYMSIPSTSKQLLPDVNTIIKQMKVTTS